MQKYIYFDAECPFSGTADLYGSLDPFQRQPRSPKALALSSEVEIIKVDLSGYSQVRRKIQYYCNLT